jgi:hypothetical protein
MSVVCATLVAAAAIAGHLPGTCVLRCDLTERAFISGSRREGTGSAAIDRSGVWYAVRFVDDRWVMVLEQHPDQCRHGGFSRLTEGKVKEK